MVLLEGVNVYLCMSFLANFYPPKAIASAVAVDSASFFALVANG